mmetsp:Transcript_44622/g.128025  ORF Transcript_44622/g.128025 Transcript_44622/m.128025 type:complete len:672 (+) Transcript_44622:65-2080(+)|eukprot:CAMPEP_0177165448 /NCGR_PEP_ID=MMETSP0367-20130122/7506_1 /TAXON_ID=447022 ORGANISM="Scrippsiella hangoei-like, Strain SHHI-4" /NCGR_SAMPLE_ID=MMETSP0367 /ASSEMBLY_ACC=CAM_ASM_000362 /LENGTH=671 /DNA_ID=CAMNT_0018611451 /DNA_START=63 /DNA_END=2078 /DNA_ORIENTATION=+
MKFGKSIGTQQDSNSDLHYVDYKLLKKRIKDVVSCQEAHELAEALTANTGFEEELAGEIALVNGCFAKSQQDLLSRTATLAEELNFHPGQSSSSRELAQAGGSAGSDAAAASALAPFRFRHRPETFKALVCILREVDQLRKYAVWNAVAVVKILKKRRKQTNLGIENMAAERAGWLSRQSFFSGSDFAELHAAIESLGHVLVLSELAPGHTHTSQQNQREKETQQCPICLDTISDMVELACNHRFCWKCFVLGPIAHQPGEYRISQCPICRQEAVPDSSSGVGGVQGSVQGGMGLGDGEGVVVPSTDGLLTRFLHTYFPQEAESIQQGIMAADEDDDGETEDMRDVVGELVKALLADSNWKGPGRGEGDGEQPSSGSAGVPSDFFQTLPKDRSLHERQMMSAAQKLQWVQLASTGDPLAVDGMAYCSLCSEPLLMEAVVTTPCKHHFHKICINRIDLPQCPLCSTNLPFSWFVPHGHHCAENGFRVVTAQRYRPEFPGGPSVGSCGYPLHRPPPESLFGRGGLAMKSYLHRILPSHEPACDSPRSNEATTPAPASPQHRHAESPDGGSSASESSSDESGSDDGCDDAPSSPSGRRKGERGERKWAFGALGRMRLVPAPVQRYVHPGRAEEDGRARQASLAASSSCAAQHQHKQQHQRQQAGQQVLLIGEHL